MPDDTNVSTRKLLKQIGLKSSAAVKRVARDSPNAGGRVSDTRLVLKIRLLDLEGTVAGQITGRG